jgi:hypothetical protein
VNSKPGVKIAGGTVLLCAAWLAAISTPPAQAQQDPDLERLVEKITRGDETEAREAAERLIERVIGPVAQALGSVESRPAKEQMRVREVLARLSAALRVRLFRADLEAAERKLYDEFAAQYPELVEQLFHDDYRKRLGAVRRIPLEPGTGAGVLVVGKVNDSDGDVAAAALEAAAALHDDVVIHGLTRYVRDVTAAIKSGFYGPGEEEAAIVVGTFVDGSIRILGEARARESVPVILEALSHFGETYPTDFFDVAQVAIALGKMGDERAAPVLLKFIDRNRPYRFHFAGPDNKAVQTIGDAVLLSLLRIYEIQPEALGFFVAAPPSSFAGFVDDKYRQVARHTFRKWYQQNADKPRSERRAPTTQPAGTK